MTGHWLMQAAPAIPGATAALYKPFMILFIILLMAILSAVVYYLWRQVPPSDPSHSEEFSSIEKFKELVRSILTATLTAGFIVLTFEDKIDAGIFGNTYAIIIAFWFGQKLGEQQGRKQVAGNGTIAPTTEAPKP